MKKHIALMAGILALGACATQNPRNVSMNELPFYEGSDQSMWIATQKMSPYYPADMEDSGTEGCVTVHYEIKRNGTIGRYKVMKSVPEGVFDKYAEASLRYFRHRPSDNNGERDSIVTSATFGFTVPGQETSKERLKQVTSACEMDNSARIAKLK